MPQKSRNSRRKVEGETESDIKESKKKQQDEMEEEQELHDQQEQYTQTKLGIEEPILDQSHRMTSCSRSSWPSKDNAANQQGTEENLEVN